MSEWQVTTTREIARLDRRYSGSETTEYPLHLLRAQAALLGLPALRAAYPMSSVDYTAANRAIDTSGQGNHLGDAGGGANVEFSYDTTNPFAPIAIFNGGANDYLSRADGGAGNWADILGTEAYIRAAERGLTLGGWFWWSALPGAFQYLIAKDDVGANRQYLLYLLNTNAIRFQVWAGPIGVTSAAAINVGWNHCVGIYDQPSQTLYVVLNGVVTAGGAGTAPAALADTAAPFTIGASGAGTSRFTGYGSMCSLQACSMYDGGNFRQILGLRQQTRSVFGV